MRSDERNIIPTVQWVQPVASHSLLLRSYLITNEKSLERKKSFGMFNEIFPAKTSIKSIDFIDDYEETDDTFHRAIGPILLVGQLFGIMPVLGISRPESSSLKFSWFTWRVAFTLLSLAASLTLTMLSILRMAFSGVDISKTTNAVFFGSTSLALILFLRLAPKWPAIGAAMAYRERNHLSHTHSNRRSLRSKFRICCFAILFLALIEHILAVFSGIAVTYECLKDKSVLETYFTGSYMQTFYFIDYSPWIGFLLQYINLESAFNWNFMDLFIIVMSLSLTDRFDHLNDRLEAVKGRYLPEQFWKLAREEYAHISRLVKKIDSHINEIVLLSFANNLYFICLQLFNTLNNAKEEKNSDCRNTSHRYFHGFSYAYFAFSFALLLTRSVAVSLSAAQINSASRKPAAALYATPATSYGTEVRRFLDQVVSDTIALTGLNFFNVTRGLVLTIAGTIVTYELVLVQFNTTPPPVQANITIGDTCGTIPIKA